MSLSVSSHTFGRCASFCEADALILVLAVSHSAAESKLAETAQWDSGAGAVWNCCSGGTSSTPAWFARHMPSKFVSMSGGTIRYQPTSASAAAWRRFTSFPWGGDRRSRRSALGDSAPKDRKTSFRVWELELARTVWLLPRYSHSFCRSFHLWATHLGASPQARARMTRRGFMPVS